MDGCNFVIVSAPRTGSTLLRTCLDSLEGVICHGEVLGINRVMGVSHKIGNVNIEELFDLRRANDFDFLSALKFYKEEKNTIGLKALYYQLLHRQTSGVMDLFIKDKNIKIIHLWRKNLDKRFYSEAILNYQVKAKRQGLELVKHSCSTEEVFRDAELTIRSANIVNDIFKSHNVLNICYEDFVGSENSRHNLVKFLGLDPLSQSIKIPDKRISFQHPVQILFDGKEEALGYYRENVHNLPPLDLEFC